jgi:hypothetical protein
MSNKYTPHLMILPEDDANKDIALGFQIHDTVNTNAVQILPVAGGWLKAVDIFLSDLAPTMVKLKYRYVAIIVDLDRQIDRYQEIKNKIPRHLQDRVFILSTLSQPENLKSALNLPFEEIGKQVANDCFQGSDTLWQHRLLSHNLPEISTLQIHVRPFLFTS